MKKSICIFLIFLVTVSGFAQDVDLDVVNRIKQEGLNNSKIEDIAFHLTDSSGPRLTNSPGYKRASEWTGTWIMQNVSVDGIDRTSFFTGMTLSFTSSSYSASNAAPVFPSSGNWTIEPDGASITRSDGVLLIIQQLSDTSLKIGLVWTETTYGPGRSSSIAGSHVFTFSK